MRRDQRPVFLNLLKIRLPVTGVVSFAHRVSGVLMVMAIPFSIFLLERSLAGPAQYASVSALLASPWVAPLSVLLAWSLLHHLFAGIRFLLIDLDVGVDKPAAIKTAWAVLAAAVVVVVVLLSRWWL